MTRLWPEGEPLEVWGGEETPAGFAWPEPSQGIPRGGIHRVVDVCNRWRVHARWWEPDEALWREYVKVTTDTGLLCLLYRDLLRGGWFLARVYD